MIETALLFIIINSFYLLLSVRKHHYIHLIFLYSNISTMVGLTIWKWQNISLSVSWLIFLWAVFYIRNSISIDITISKKKNLRQQILCRRLQEKFEHENQSSLWLERQQNELDHLYEGMKNLNSTLFFEDSMEIFSHTLHQLGQFQDVILVLLHMDSPAKIIMYRLYHKEHKSGFELIHTSLSVIQKDLMEQCIQSQKIEHNSSGLHWQAIPLIHEKDVLGVLLLESSDVEHFNSIEILAIHFAMEIRKTRLYQTVQELSVIDGLTQVYLRRHVLNLLENEKNRMAKHQQSFSILILDVDYFKNVNDTYGHLMGDKILKGLVQLLKKQLRPFDIIGRYGGEEFIIGLPETSKKDATWIADRFRQSIAQNEFECFGKLLHITVSIGLSSFPEDGQELSLMIELADQALYQAKHNGRNIAQPWVNPHTS